MALLRLEGKGCSEKWALEGTATLGVHASGG